jgi:hypothetical protein
MDDLAHLLGAYFYEDWDEYEYQSWQEAVDDFARRSPRRVSGAIAALQDLLEAGLTDAQLEDHLRSAGCTFVSEQGDREWLQLMLKRLTSTESGSQPLSRAN